MTVRLIDTEWEKVPLVARTNTVYPPRGVEPDVDTESREFALPPDVRVTVVGFRDIVGPLPTVAVRFTFPENPLTLESVRPAVVEEPCETVSEIGVATNVKSGGGGDLTSKNT